MAPVETVEPLARIHLPRTNERSRINLTAMLYVTIPYRSCLVWAPWSWVLPAQEVLIKVWQHRFTPPDRAPTPRIARCSSSSFFFFFFF